MAKHNFYHQRIPTSYSFNGCRFCQGRGCLACAGEQEREQKLDEERMKHSFENPFLVLKGNADEDPVGWEILTKTMHRDVVENIYRQSPSPEIAGALLNLLGSRTKREILDREADIEKRELETSIGRFESEGGSNGRVD
jgi:hypothetical protein